MHSISIAAVLLTLPALATPTSAQPVTDLRESQPQREAALDKSVARLMRLTRTPGVAVAYVAGGRVQFVRYYGTQDLWAHTPVTAQTVFDGASNGKPIEAYVAMRLVDRGALQLDRPLEDYLAKPYLDPVAWSREVTLRRVLSHTSGLPNRVWEHAGTLAFRPGQRFSYSGSGYVLLQKVLEEVTGLPYEVLVRREVLAPLGMNATSFVFDPRSVPWRAWGHIRLSAPVDPYLAVFFEYCLPGAIIVLLMVQRLVTGAWRPRGWTLIGACAVAVPVSLIPFAHIFGVSAFTVWVPIALAVVVAMGLGWGAASLLRWSFLRIRPQESAGWWPLNIVLAAVFVWGVREGVADMLIPVPPIKTARPIAPSTLSTTASDLALFAAELSRPTLLSAPTVARMRAPQVWLNDRIGWALGFGVEKESRGELTYWQWGDNPGSQGLLVVDPQRADAVVVMTNGAQGLNVARPVARLLLGFEGVWSIKP